MIEFLKRLFKPNFCKCHEKKSEAFERCFSPTTKLDTNNPPVNPSTIKFDSSFFDGSSKAIGSGGIMWGEIPKFKSVEKKYERDSRGRFKKKGT